MLQTARVETRFDSGERLKGELNTVGDEHHGYNGLEVVKQYYNCKILNENGNAQILGEG